MTSAPVLEQLVKLVLYFDSLIRMNPEYYMSGSDTNQSVQSNLEILGISIGGIVLSV